MEVSLRRIHFLFPLRLNHIIDLVLMLLKAIHSFLHELAIPQLLEPLLGRDALCMLRKLVNAVQLGLLRHLLRQLLLLYFLQRLLILPFDVLTGIFNGALSHRQIVAERLVVYHWLLSRVE